MSAAIPKQLRAYMSAIGTKGGAKSSAAKTAAARTNAINGWKKRRKNKGKTETQK